MKRILIPLVGALAAAVACSGPGGEHAPARVRIAAASDLNAALGDLGARFKASHRIDVAVSYGSSGTFYTQLLNGAPFDVFLSADVAYPRQLADRGLTIAGSEFTYAVGRIVVWVPASSTFDVAQFGVQGLAAPSVRRIAIANPDHAPYGRAAVAALQKAGIYDTVRSRLVLGESVAQAMQFVQSGSADAGIVALSLALAPKASDGRWIEIPVGDYPRIEQGGIVLKQAANVAAAQAFRAFMIGAEGRRVLQRYGFATGGE